MRIALISFTNQGGRTCRMVCDSLMRRGEMCLAYGTGEAAGENDLITFEKGLVKWAKEAFENNDALIFIGAAGIAVRAVAPHITSKDKDPAVIVIDEKGQYVISLLSGHLGGANKLTQTIAEDIGGIPVITTATDINGKFAVDLWAKEQNLYIVNLKAAKRISSDILKGKKVYLYYGGTINGEVPKGIEIVDVVTLKEKIREKESCIIITEKILESLKGSDKFVLQLVPRNICIGMGCRKDISFKAVCDLFEKSTDSLKIRKEALLSISSIDLKKSEKALIKLSEKWKIPYITFSQEELMQVEGEFTASEFVKNITGVENVCERAAVLAAGKGGELILNKQSLNGVTFAASKKEINLDF